jgi:putative two-component system response regulator
MSARRFDRAAAASSRTQFGSVTALVVQPDRELGELLCGLLDARGVRSTCVADPAEARELLARATFDLVVSDAGRKGLGIGLAVEVSRRQPATATIVFAARHDPDLALAALERGLDDYVTQPMLDERLEMAIPRALRRRDERLAPGARVAEIRRLRELAAVGEVREQTLAELVLERLARAGRFHDEETAEHVERVSRSCALIARRLGWDARECANLRAASAMHDIGKVGVSDAVLLKPSRLTAAERTLVETHAQIGHEILRGSEDPVLELGATIALTHHERFDGGGYPRGLQGEAIPLVGRIAAVADVFDALTHDRVYRAAFSAAKALGMLREEAGKHFDPGVVDAFEAALPEIEELAERYPDSHDGEDSTRLFVAPERPTRVLIVGLDGAVVHGLELLLKEEGFEFAGSADSVTHAQGLLDRRSPDVVVLGRSLLEADALELVVSARALGVRVLLYTGSTDGAGAAAARASGADAVAVDTGTTAHFVETLRAVARGDAVAEPQPAGGPAAKRGRRLTLTPREREIVGLLAKGLSGAEIAEHLFLSPETVRTHLRNARERTGTKTRSHLVALAANER